MLVVFEVIEGELAPFAVFEPFLADLIAADVEIPDFFGDALKILFFVNPDAPRVQSPSFSLFVIRSNLKVGL